MEFIGIMKLANVILNAVIQESWTWGYSIYRDSSRSHGVRALCKSHRD